MKRIRINISYIIGVILLGLIAFEVFRMVRTINSVGDFIYYIPETICYIGGVIFVLGNILGILPVGNYRKELFEGLCGYLKENGEKPLASYRIPEEYYERLRKDIRDEEVLNLIAQDVVSYCGVKVGNLIIYNQNNLVAAAGLYNPETDEIHISVPNTRTIDEVLAVLIHECMHYILKEKELWLEDDRENEFLTDLACLFYGFTDQINKGYIMVGYLKRNEIRYIRKLIKRFYVKG